MDNLASFQKEIHLLMDEGEYEKAKTKLIEKLESSKNDEDNYPNILAECAGFLIDIGSEALDKEAAEAGVKILSTDEEYFKSFVSEQSFNYCLANGLHALYKIETKDIGFPTLEMIKPNLSEAKNYYYKAFKSINLENIDHIGLQILTNLGSNLSKGGRSVDAIRLYKTVLKNSPNFRQALIGLAVKLSHWKEISFCPVYMSLYSTIYELYKNGLSSGEIPQIHRTNFEEQLKKYEEKLNDNEFDFSKMEKEFLRNEEEFSNHSVFRKFCIDNFLVLNEHSLFCKCFGVAKDDLSLVHVQISLYGDKVGRMELLLNRLKSEFGLARRLYFEGVSANITDEDILFSDLLDWEVIGEKVEKIKTSLRMCFGILDKIAHGICYFFELPKGDKENIYFDRFWEGNKNRWEVLKKMENPHLVALYSIANDLNSKGGEFHFYKQWRNKLEHNNLILVDKTDDPDLFKLFDDDSFISKVAYAFFEEQALHLLQMSCAAIYSYVYAIRTETMHNSGDKPTMPLIIQPRTRF